jgi:SAM-dependent methyltransferase
MSRWRFDPALDRARVSAYAPGEFAGQEGFMTAGEISALAAQAGIGPGVAVLDVCCGTGGPGRLLTGQLGCAYLGVDESAVAVTLARERTNGLPCRFAVAQVPPLPAGSFDVVLLLEAMLAFEDKDALVRDIAAALRPGGRFAFTLEEGPPLTTAERSAMPAAGTVWPAPLDEMTACLERSGLVVTWQEDRSAAHAGAEKTTTLAITAIMKRIMSPKRECPASRERSSAQSTCLVQTHSPHGVRGLKPLAERADCELINLTRQFAGVSVRK